MNRYPSELLEDTKYKLLKIGLNLEERGEIFNNPEAFETLIRKREMMESLIDLYSFLVAQANLR